MFGLLTGTQGAGLINGNDTGCQEDRLISIVAVAMQTGWTSSSLPRPYRGNYASLKRQCISLAEQFCWSQQLASERLASAELT